MEIVRALSAGKKVVIDNTNLWRNYLKKYYIIAYKCGITNLDQIMLADIDYNYALDRCLERIKERDTLQISVETLQRQAEVYHDQRAVITEMDWEIMVKRRAQKQVSYYEVPEFEVVPVAPLPDLPKAIICDIDGTLAHRALLKQPRIHYRSFYSYKECETDLVDEVVRDALKGFQQMGYQIIFVSGRKKDCRTETLDFLKRAGFAEGDYLIYTRDEEKDIHEELGVMVDDSDALVKYRLFNEHIRDKYNVMGVIDDRKRVVALWETLGLRVFNVGLLNEHF